MGHESIRAIYTLKELKGKANWWGLENDVSI